MKFAITVSLLLLILSAEITAQGLTPTAPPMPSIQTADSVKASKEQPEKDSKDEQSKVYQEMFDKLVDRATWVFGVVGGFMMLLGTVIIGLVWWTLGQARKDAKLALQDELQRRGLANLDAEIKNVQTQFNAINAFKGRRVVWICPEGVAEPAKELAFLKRAGLHQVTTISVPEGQPTPILNDPDLVILSFNGSQQSKDLVKLSVDVLKRSQKEVPVLVYAPLGGRIDPPEMQLLNETALHAIANFPATLVTQALELVRLRQA